MYVPDKYTHRIFITLALTCFFTSLFSLGPIREYIGLWMSPRDTIFALETPASQYNEALELAQIGDYPSSRVILEDLVRDPPPELSPYQSNTYELYGDILYKLGGATGDILKLYTLAGGSNRPDRIEKKISLLSSPLPGVIDRDPGGTGSISSTPILSNFSSGEISDIDKTFSEILSDQSEAQRYIYPANGIPRSETEQLSDIRAFLDEDVEYIDW